jgi:hypothetical protein
VSGSPSRKTNPVAARAAYVQARWRSCEIASIGWQPGCQCTTSLEVRRELAWRRGGQRLRGLTAADRRLPRLGRFE